jgi:hypothetical protein
MITGKIPTKIGEIPIVSTKLSINDIIGAIKVRWSIGRNNFKVSPGIYAVGAPDETSDVFVTANYKLSFDHLRKNLDGLNCWILVLNTRGINVWCAAGKGTFSTKELVHRIQVKHLAQLINHRRLILPQLGAVGVSAHIVERYTRTEKEPTTPNNGIAIKIDFDKLQVAQNKGFSVKYGPIKASDIKDFIKAGYKATNEMRKVNFGIGERLTLIPVDFIYGAKYLLSGIVIMILLSGINKSGFALNQIFANGFKASLNILFAYIAGIVITPIFLPYLPGRPFALKGFLAGLIVFAVLTIFSKTGNSIPEILSWFLIISGLASFVAMNFTGSSTFTSLSGVKKEMKVAIPIQVLFSVGGLLLFVFNKLFNL